MTRGGLKALFDESGKLRQLNLLDVATHGLVVAREAVVAREILVNASRSKTRLPLEPALDDVLERVELRGPLLAAVDGLHPLGEITFDGSPVATDHSADLGVGKPLTMQGFYVHQLLLIDHQVLTSLWKLASVSEATPEGEERSFPEEAKAGSAALHQDLHFSMFTELHYSVFIDNHARRAFVPWAAVRYIQLLEEPGEASG